MFLTILNMRVKTRRIMRMTKMINRMEGVGFLGSLQFKLWWWHPGQREAVQEEKVEVIIIELFTLKNPLIFRKSANSTP